MMDDTSDDIEAVTSFGNIAFFDATVDKANGTAATPIKIITGYTGTDLDAMDTVNTYFNWNVANLVNSTQTLNEVALVTSDGSEVVSDTTTSGIAEISASGVTRASDGALYLNVSYTAAIGR